MPCTDGGAPYPPTREQELEAKAPAMLCAITKVLDDSNIIGTIFDRVDWATAGVTAYEFQEWWELHKEKDRQRMRDEVRNAERERKRKDALAKLTKADRKALGLE